jgi:tetratricopeptide (TPR) repeat protein
MKKHVFVYDIHMKDVDAQELDLADEHYVGVGCLYGYKRFGVHFTEKTDDSGAAVVGDIFLVDEKVASQVDSYYRKFSYKPVTEAITLLKDGENIECTFYLKVFQEYFFISHLKENGEYDQALDLIDDQLKKYDGSNDDFYVHLVAEKAELLFLSSRYTECVDFIWGMIDEGILGEEIYWIIDAYDKLIESEPDNIDLYIGKAKAAVYVRLSYAPHPMTIFEKVLELDERNIILFPHFIKIFEDMQLEFDPSDSIIIETLIYLHFKLKKYDKMLEYLNESDKEFYNELHMKTVNMIFQAFIAERRYSEGVQFCDRLLETDDFADSEVVIEIREKLLSMGKNDK